MPEIAFIPSSSKLEGIAPYPEPTAAIKDIPNWYKKQPSYLDGKKELIDGHYHATVKKCLAIFDSMTAGYLLKAPCDIFIDTTENPMKINIPAELLQHTPYVVAGHAEEQVSHMPIDKDFYIGSILRIHPLWVVKTEPGYSCLFTQPLPITDSPIHAVAGIVDTDEFASDGHLSFFVKKDFKGIIKQGTPLVQVIPFKREKWTHTIEDSQDDFLLNQRAVVRSTFMNGYRSKLWSKKVFD